MVSYKKTDKREYKWLRARLRVTASDYEPEYEWLRVITSDYKRLKLTTSDYEPDYVWLQATTSDYEWLRVTTSDHKLLRARLRVTTSDYKCLRRTTNDYQSSYEWLQVMRLGITLIIQTFIVSYDSTTTNVVNKLKSALKIVVLHFLWNYTSTCNVEAVVRRCSSKQVFLKILEISQENTCVRAFFEQSCRPSTLQLY